MANKCLYCGKDIPLIRKDSLGRDLTKTTKFCNNNQKCRNAFFRSTHRKHYKEYMHNYYMEHKEKDVNDGPK
jgi:hypothetical protein